MSTFPSLHLLAAATVPLTPARVHEALFSNASLAPNALAARLHAARGDSAVTATPWRYCGSSGSSSRTLAFTARVKAPSGLPQHAACTRTETLTWLPKKGFVLDGVQLNGGVPYGSCFRVLTRWEAQPAGQHSTALRFGCAVDFSSSLLLRRLIEKTTLAQSRDAAQQALTALSLENESLARPTRQLWHLDVPVRAAAGRMLLGSGAGGALTVTLALALLARARRPPRKPPAARLARRLVVRLAQAPQLWCCAY